MDEVVVTGRVKKEIVVRPRARITGSPDETVCQYYGAPFGSCAYMARSDADVLARQQGVLALGGAVVLTSMTGIQVAIAVRGAAAALETTAHGATRIAGAAATRGGVLSLEEIAATRASGVLYESAKNGTIVHVLEASAGRYNVVVDGAKGLVTTLRNIDYKALTRLACNYGWSCPL